MTMATMLMSLIRMFRLGPAVSLKGSPTVSPMTAALWAGEPLPPKFPSSMYFLALSQAPPALAMNTARTKPGRGPADEQAHDAGNAQEEAGDDGDDDGQERGQDHVPLGAARRDLDAAGVVGLGLALHDARDLPELPPHLVDHPAGRLADGRHGQAAEDEGHHGAEEDADEDERVHQVDVVVAHEVE